MRVQSLAPLSGLRIWYCHELQCTLQVWLGSGIAVAVAHSWSSNSAASLGTSICHRCSSKKQKKKKKAKKLNHRKRNRNYCFKDGIGGGGGWGQWQEWRAGEQVLQDKQHHLLDTGTKNTLSNLLSSCWNWGPDPWRLSGSFAWSCHFGVGQLEIHG